MNVKVVTRTVVSLGAAALAIGGLADAAHAQGLGVSTRARSFVEQHPLTLQVGGGFENLTEKGAQDVTSAGGQWTVRAVLGEANVLGVEAAYLGSAQGYSQAGVGDGTLVRNGVEAMARLGYPVRSNRGFLTPYATAGLGWNVFTLAGVDAAGLNKNDSVLTIPFGGGLVAGYDRYSLDLRAVYRPAFGDTMFDNVSNSIFTAGLNSYALTAALGYTF